MTRSVIGLFLALVFPLSASADDLYISGGGGGGGSPTTTGGQGGDYAGNGDGNFGGGGGGYVGDGSSLAGDGSGSNGGGHHADSIPGWNTSATDGSNGVSPVSGGAGGNAAASRTGDSSAYDNIRVVGGMGGMSSGMNDAGQGGDAALSVSGKLSVNAELHVVSGFNGANAGGAGGKASFTAGALAAPRILLSKIDGGLTVNVGVLDVTANDTILYLTSTNASDVVFHNINLGGGHTLTLSRYFGGDFSFNTLNVYGAATYTDSNPLNAVGKALNFYVPAGTTSGTTLLTVTGDADITNSVVNIALQGTST
ncbi:MAG: hypothetical protein LBU53_02615, partial [Zoogloeaceae bacterium]|nr:hypothetical protein [Zoogloeaceae bacterium]